MKNFNDVISEVDDVISSAKKGNFDEVLNKTKSYAETAAKRSAERLEISRRKIELLDAKTKLSKAFEKYGRLVYESDGGEKNQEAFDSALAEIQLNKTRAEMLEKEIEELKSRRADSEETETVELEAVDVSEITEA